MINKPVYFSGRTAIVRKAPAKPLQTLAKMGLIKGWTLYLGRGKDYPGVDLIKSIVGNNQTVDYDPYHPPLVSIADKPLAHGIFDTVLSIYTLNVIGKKERTKAIEDIYWYLNQGGNALIAVRGRGDYGYKKSKDWKVYGDGFITSRGTFQKFYTPTILINELKPHFKTVELIHGTSHSAEILVKATK